MAEPRRAVIDEFRYIPVVACVLLVTLRLFIGWQFLYEGLWKVDTLDTPQPWTAAGFLKNAQGPFRGVFREQMTDDADELGWLDEKVVAARWDSWAERFTAHYGLDDRQKAQLDLLVNGPREVRVPLEALPAGIEIPKDLRGNLKFDAKGKRLVLNAETPLTPSEKESLLALAAEPAAEDTGAEAARAREFRAAVVRLAEQSAKLDYKQKLRSSLGPGDPNRVRQLFGNFKGTLGDRAPERIDEFYRKWLADYETRLERAGSLPFQRDHLDREWREIQKLRAELTNPVKALESSLKADANQILTAAQLAKGPVPEPRTTQALIDGLTIFALIALGVMLIAGFGTRIAAVAGAGMVLSFYLVWPPWPGVPVDPGPEHAFIVNKNLIEVVALLALAALPSGQWFGIDGLIYRAWKRLQGRTRKAGPVTAPVSREPAVVAAGR